MTIEDVRKRWRTDLELVRVEPQPSYIKSSGRWCWPLPEHARFPGCCTEVVTASREWWEYAPSQARPHPMAECVMLRDGQWYWAMPNTDIAFLLSILDAIAAATRVRPDEDYPLWVEKVHALATRGKE